MTVCAVWIRNTVNDCLEAADLLRADGLDPLVFHARFAQGDRQAREQEVMQRFGPNTDGSARRGQVLVATQVVEQSLDLDFDAMVTDLAPVDLVVQRAGRLWRHSHRDGARPQGSRCELVVLAPAVDEPPTDAWLAGPFRGTAYVYPHPGVLWRTARLLSERKVIATPDDMRALIEGVYASDETPEALQRAADRALGAQHGQAAMATYAALKVADGYDASQSAWLSDLRAPTRLGDEQTVIRLARVEDGTLQPWIDDDLPWKAWTLSEVRVRRTRVPFGCTVDPDLLAAGAAARSTWGRFDDGIVLLPLRQIEKGQWMGTLHRVSGGTITLGYSRDHGLSFAAPPQVGRLEREAVEVEAGGQRVGDSQATSGER